MKKSISFVLTLCLVLSLFSTFVLPISAEGSQNIALGKTYTYPTEGLYYHWSDEWAVSDNAAKALTDGFKAASYYGEAAVTGWNGAGVPVEIVIDLEAVCSIDSFAYTVCAGTDGISEPAAVAISVSNDGTTFEEVEVTATPGEAIALLSWTTCYYRNTVATPASAVEGRYVKFAFTKTATFVFLNELEVFGEEPALALPSNLSQCSTDTYGDISVLTDGYTGVGEVTTYDGFQSKLFGISNANKLQSEYFFNVSLGEEKVIDGVTLYALDFYNGCVHIPEAVTFVINGVAYDATINANPNGIATIVADLGAAVTTSVVKVKVTMAASEQEFAPFNMFTELEVEEAFLAPDGYIVVDSDNGKWQAAEGDFEFAYKYAVVGENLVVDVIVNDDLVNTPADKTSGNGFATNIRLWVNYGAEKWDRLYDGFVVDGAAKLYSKNSAGTEGTEGTIALAENVFTFTLPCEEVGNGNGVFQFTICVSNTDADGTNNACLYAPCETFAWSAWDGTNAHTINLINKVEVNIDEYAMTTDGVSDFTEGWSNVGNTKVALIGNNKCTTRGMDVIVTYPLGETLNIDSFTMDFYYDKAVMIGYPEGKVLIEVSTDGETYTEVGEFDFKAVDFEATSCGTASNVFEFSAVDAAYVRATFYVGSSTGVLGDSPADGKIFWEFVSIAEVEVSEYVAPVTSKVVTDWNPANYGSSIGGATGAFIYDDAEIYAACGNNWWVHASFAPSADVEGGYEVVAIRPASENAFLEIPEGGFVWMAWSSAGDTPESSGAYALAMLNSLEVGDIVIFNGVDFANKTTTADATAEIWVDPDAPVNIALGKDYTLSGCGNRSSYYGDLTDGNAVMNLNGDNNANWFGFYCNGTDASVINAPGGVGYAIIDLEALYDISSIRVGLIANTDWGISAPGGLKAYGSIDGETFTEIGTFSFSLENGVGVWTSIDSTATARYIKIEVTLAGTFAFLNEVEVYGTAAEVVEEDDDSFKEFATYVDGDTVGTIQQFGDDKPASDFWYYIEENDEKVLIAVYVDNRDVVEDDTQLRIWIDADMSDTARTTLVDLKKGADGVYVARVDADMGAAVLEIAYDEAGNDYAFGIILDKATLGIDGEYGLNIQLGETGRTTMHSIKYDNVTGAGATYAPWNTTEFYEVFGKEPSTVTPWGDGAGVEVMTDGYTGVGDITGYEGNGDKLYGFGNSVLTATNYEFDITIDEATFDAITLYTLDYAGGGVMLPDGVVFVVNGVEYTATITANANGIATIVAELEEAVTASKITVKVAMGESPYSFGIFNMFTELEVSEAVAYVTGQFDDEGLNGVNQFAASANNIWFSSFAANTWWGAVTLEWNEDAAAWEVVKVELNSVEKDGTLAANQIAICVHVDNGADYEKLISLKVGDLVYIWDVVASSDLLNPSVDCNGGFWTTDPDNVGETALVYKEYVNRKGDVDMDRDVDATDYAIIRKLVLGTIGDEEFTDEQLALADINGNGVIDANDYVIAKRHALGTFVIPDWR